MKQIGAYEDVHDLRDPEVLERIAWLDPCGDPNCVCADPATPRVAALLMADPEQRRWLVVGFSAEPEQWLAEVGTTDREQARRLALLYGVSWYVMEKVPPGRIYRDQQAAANETPGRLLEADLADLHILRGLIKESAPTMVSRLVCMTETWAADVGGTAGVTPT